jgi:mRNA interferase RelE/StbE
MARYEALIKGSALVELASISRQQDFRRVVRRIRALGSEPRPPGCEKLGDRGQGSRNYRVRQRDFRIIYQVSDASATVVVIKIGDRKDVYRRL